MIFQYEKELKNSKLFWVSGRIAVPRESIIIGLELDFEMKEIWINFIFFHMGFGVSQIYREVDY